ncbi:MAG: 2-oxoacid:acceptor oxidoreductase family protein [Clostridia bacterium]|nr:2-oxoacid:acceptor oxidoreductase family protein [Clostridia bacterium]
MTKEILIAGFGGQGVLFAGKLLAHIGLHENKQLSWLPSYGPEMRGGTANCSVIISDEPVGSPIVTKPDILIAMNLPSLDKYENDVVPGGVIIVDSSLVTRKVNRDDVTVFYIPATSMANEINAPTLANMIIIGKLIKETNVVSYSEIDNVLAKIVSARHQNLLEINKKAIDAGYNYI